MRDEIERTFYDDPDLDVRVIWKCGLCGREREEPLGYNEGGWCDCGGQWMRAGESYNDLGR